VILSCSPECDICSFVITFHSSSHGYDHLEEMVMRMSHDTAAWKYVHTSVVVPLEKGHEEKLLFKVTNGRARTKTQHHLWTVNIVKTALTRNVYQGLSGDESFFSSVELCLLFCVKGYFFKGEKRLYPRKELPTTVSLYRLYWVFFKS